MPKLVLKIDVDTYRGTREGVPNLIRILQQHHAGATFLFSLGPDHTGWALKRIFRPGFFSKVSRTSVVEHYGLKTLMYGVLLPAPHIGKTCAQHIQTAHSAGFECGIHTYDHVFWQDNVAKKNAIWTETQMMRAQTEFMRILGYPAATHGAAGWQMNKYGLQWENAKNMRYASDGRGTSPYRVQVDNTVLDCVQMPTTLPTLDELIGLDGNTPENVHEHMLKLTAIPRDHVYTLHAELEGAKLSPAFEKMLQGWQAQGYELCSMGNYYRTLNPTTLPIYDFEYGEIAGRSGSLMIQPEQPCQPSQFNNL